ncbi:hypothetical protein MTO96_021585 [Rhipicephalus appendiculatus]
MNRGPRRVKNDQRDEVQVAASRRDAWRRRRLGAVRESREARREILSAVRCPPRGAKFRKCALPPRRQCSRRRPLRCETPRFGRVALSTSCLKDERKPPLVGIHHAAATENSNNGERKKAGTHACVL